MDEFHNNAIFWVDVNKITPNPYQPRREFDPGKLQDLADSIRQYGVLQPLVVTRTEVYGDDGGMTTEYELIAGERRLRASKLAGVSQVPVVIRAKEDSNSVKLELAIIENLQREDLNAVDRARAFARLADEFGYKHGEIGKKVGRSREYVSNTIRVLALPEDMLIELSQGKMREGYSRPLLMLSDRPEEQQTLFKEIVFKRLTVRDAERVSRRIAVEKARTYDPGLRPEIREFEEEIGESLGTRVLVKKNPSTDGGRVVINFASEEDLQKIMQELKANVNRETTAPAQTDTDQQQETQDATEVSADNADTQEAETRDDESDDLYSLNHFSI